MEIFLAQRTTPMGQKVYVYLVEIIEFKIIRVYHTPKEMDITPLSHVNIFFKMEPERIWIGDIRGLAINKGHGSIAIRELIRYCLKQDYKKIEGIISSVDWDHVDRLEHFYKKHGFTINLNHKKQHGEISLELNNKKAIELTLLAGPLEDEIKYLRSQIQELEQENKKFYRRYKKLLVEKLSEHEVIKLLKRHVFKSRIREQIRYNDRNSLVERKEKRRI
ncbi:hypothetical protein ASG97_21420 [Bacillus sp. Soil745]|nr:hypothetical protein ASG97_21420 [Bacillus sp. Soil745]